MLGTQKRFCLTQQLWGWRPLGQLQCFTAEETEDHTGEEACLELLGSGVQTRMEVFQCPIVGPNLAPQSYPFHHDPNDHGAGGGAS